MSDTATIAPAAATTFEACKQAIIPILAAHGIARVTIDYNGEGDEGQVNDVLAFDAAGEQVALPTVDCERHQLGYDGTIASDVTDLASALDSSPQRPSAPSTWAGRTMPAPAANWRS